MASEPKGWAVLNRYRNSVQLIDAIKGLRSLSSKSVGAIITSPPYNTKESTHRQKNICNWKAPTQDYARFGEKMPLAEYEALHREIVRECWRVLRDDGVLFYNHKPKTKANVMWSPDVLVQDVTVRQRIVWNKSTGHMNCNRAFFAPTYEFVYFIPKPRFRLAYGAQNLGDVWNIAAERRRQIKHKCPFPEAVVEKMISATNADLILDPFMGSGTVGVVAKRMGRDFIGFELNPVHVVSATERIEATPGLDPAVEHARLLGLREELKAEWRGKAARLDAIREEVAVLYERLSATVANDDEPLPPLSQRDSERLPVAVANDDDPLPTPPRRAQRVVDLFCGAGGFGLGFQQAGYELVASFDHWAPALAVQKANYNHAVHNVDLANHRRAAKIIAGYNPDLMLGSPPCTEFSSAGKRTPGEKAALTLSFAKIVCSVRPATFVMENVPPARSSLIYMKAVAILKAAGYGVTERVLDASHCGVPQKRKRLIVIGRLGEADGFIDEELLRHLSPEPLSVRAALGGEIALDHFYRHPRNYSRRAVFSVDEPAPTIRGTNSPPRAGHPEVRGNSAPVSSVRRLTYLERARIQTFPAGFKWVGTKTDIEKMIGNAVPVALAGFVGRAITEFDQHSNDNASLNCVETTKTGIDPTSRHDLTTEHTRLLEAREALKATWREKAARLDAIREEVAVLYERLSAAVANDDEPLPPGGLDRTADHIFARLGSDQEPAQTTGTTASGKRRSSLYLGSCFDLFKGLADNSVEACITDPPYFLDGMGDDWSANDLAAKAKNAGVVGGLPTGMGFDPQQGIRFQKFMGEVSREVMRVLKPGGFYISFSQGRLVHRLGVAVDDAGFEVRDLMGWTYNGQAKAFSQDHFVRKMKISDREKAALIASMGARKTPQLKSQIEPMVLARKPLEGTLVQNWQRWGVGLVDTSQSLDGQFPGQLMAVKKPTKEEKGRDNDHPTVKPVRLISHLIKLVTQEGQTVLDPFMGSGSHGVAAIQSGRKFIGFEREPKYFAISERRIAEAAGAGEEDLKDAA